MNYPLGYNRRVNFDDCMHGHIILMSLLYKLLRDKILTNCLQFIKFIIFHRCYMVVARVYKLLAVVITIKFI